jgi:hypothetical protein
MLSLEKRRSLLRLASRISCGTGLTRFHEWSQGDRWISYIFLPLTPTPPAIHGTGWTNELLRDALGVIRTHYHVLTPEEAIDCLAEPDRMKPLSVVVCTALTMKPGDLDVAAAAHSVGVPLTVYICPGMLDSAMPPWPLLLRWGIEQIERGTVDMYGRRWILNSSAERDIASAAISERLYLLPEMDRTGHVRDLLASWQIDVSDAPGLTWEDAAALFSSDLLTPGMVGYTGDSLSRLPLDRVIHELREARYMCHEKMGCDLHHILYPWGDHTPAIDSEAQRIGYASGLVLDDRTHGMNTPETGTFGLTARSLLPGPPEVMRTDLAGIHHYLSSLTAGRETMWNGGDHFPSPRESSPES